MSKPASELLRELEEALLEGSQIEGPLGAFAWHGLCCKTILLEALPETRALVEAAMTRHYEQEPSHCDMPPAWCPVCSTEAALSAKLEEQA
jgi:hypothetical protein